MDAWITAAGRALAVGDALGALNHVALRDDAPALALRGIAMAQLGDLARARALVRRAARTFGAKEPVARARCVVAEAEIALATRDLGWPQKALDAARATLEHHGDHANAVHARLLDARRLLLLGRLEACERVLAELDGQARTAASAAIHELVVAGIAMRRLRTKPARLALARAARAARASRIPGLIGEVERAARSLQAPVARLVERGTERLLRADEVEALIASTALVVDACRFVVWHAGVRVSLVKRPILFALARALAWAWPDDAPRGDLVASAFRTRALDESHRARLRVEMGRLRAALRTVADVKSTPRGFALVPRRGEPVVVLAPLVDDRHAAVLALLADGESWSTSALALALGTSQRTVQRALDSLASSGKVQALGAGRSRRWITAPLPGIATALLLPAAWPDG